MKPILFYIVFLKLKRDYMIVKPGGIVKTSAGNVTIESLINGAIVNGYVVESITAVK